jgi:acyl transferase domain-containing protein
VAPIDIAIIGLACRFPGAGNPHDFWCLLRDGIEVTDNALDNVAGFDADFFNLSPREACALDPRQRLALELTWELLEDACVPPETLSGEHVAVYLGATNDDYAYLTVRDAPGNLDHHSYVGISRGMIANRISYTFGLHGNSMTVDSGQSSSLVAVHLAGESLRTGESPLAIAGGVNLNLAHETAMLETEFGAVSSSGHTYAFDARADGYVRSEGGGLVLLKPLRAALDDGNRIRAVIRGSAVGNAGRSAAALTVPSASAEVDVIARALSTAGLDTGQIHYVEAHGTGTEIGDPIEAKALGEVFGQRRRRPVRVGSVKTNIGHAGSASGIAGLIKTVLAIENAVVPPSLNFANASPGVGLESLGLQINTRLTPWPQDEGPRRAGVSSFGMGGTNAHVVVEQAPMPESVAVQRDDVDVTVPWVLSARSRQALANQAERLLAWVGGDEKLHPADVASSLVTTRSLFEHRAVVVGAGRAALTGGLTRLVAGEPASDVVMGRARSAGKTAFVFPGQGSQWLGMGSALYGRFPVFAKAFDEAADALDGHLRLPLGQVMWGTDAALLHSTEFAQPALFAVEVALAALLRHCGIEPDFVMGHSVGEFSAACVAEVLSLTDAAMLVAARGRLMAELPEGGVMVAVAAGEDEVVPLLDAGVCIAAVNGPDAVVLSGEEAAVNAVADRFAGMGRRVHRLAVSHAFHSSLMEPMVEKFGRVAAEVSAAEPRIKLVANVSGRLAGAGYGSPEYWVQHVRQPVRFADGVQVAESLGAEVFVEVGPGAGLPAAIEQSLTAEQPVLVATMAKDRPEIESVLIALGRSFTTGLAVDWQAILAGLGAQVVGLPTYGFARQRFWLGRSDGDAPTVASRSADLSKRLQGLNPKEQRRQLVDLVCSHVAVVLAHSSGHDIDAERAFQDLGFDSMTGVELRNRLTTDTGLALPRTLIFDYPTPTALADHLGQLLTHGHEESDEEKIWLSLRRIPLGELRRTGLLDKLLLLAGRAETSLSDATLSDDVIDSLTPDDLIALALNSDDDIADGR